MDFKIEVHHHFHGDGEVLGLLRAIKAQGEKIMSAISDFADKMKVHQDHLEKDVTEIQGDLDGLKVQIKALQESVGKITPEDQALLDDIEARTAAIHKKVDDLNDLTPPVLPPTP